VLGTGEMIALGNLSVAFLFIYEGLVFATEWTIFLLLIIALYNAVLLVLRHLKDAILIWVIILVCHIGFRFFQAASYPYA
jgi:hypothetical protein